jgi:hypothetical protein
MMRGIQMQLMPKCISEEGLLEGQVRSAYGPGGADDTNMSQLNLHKKLEMDDLMARRKMLKAERVRSKAEQAVVFETMD